MTDISNTTDLTEVTKELRIYGIKSEEPEELEGGVFVVECFGSIDDSNEVKLIPLRFTEREFAEYVVNAGNALHFAQYFGMDDNGIFFSLSPTTGPEDKKMLN